ncbi:U4/U6.U5 small nuclear ribonucleoprotein 27 kDa protein isoform X1 [Thamnophis elegans]|uniref:U4/U6.U5 small nuclear ribonucleoprotein 27 kDa protein isoform X1 n=1 Tax=Thamnophis elegans TaxID=35005 RepID=UPI001377D0B6|nr:U4/U6.U5 small nuclear ribonucleoprotein 27 kDa protein isoform X1 [Thamnophis elegans]
MGRSRSRSPPRRERRRSRSTSRERERRRRERSRSRERDRRRSRSRSPHRRRSRSPRRHRSNSASPSRQKERREDEKKDSKDKEHQITEEDLEGKTEEEIEMMKMMGFGSFDTTKGKKVDGSVNAYAVNVSQKRKYRNAAPNVQGTSTMLHCCLQDTHYCTALQPFDEQTAFCYSQIFQILTPQSRAPAAIFLHLSSYVFVHILVTWPCSHVRGMAF